jgi:hypothetical protein
VVGGIFLGLRSTRTAHHQDIVLCSTDLTRGSNGEVSVNPRRTITSSAGEFTLNGGFYESSYYADPSKLVGYLQRDHRYRITYHRGITGKFITRMVVLPPNGQSCVH